MKQWQHTLNINQFINGDGTLEKAQKGIVNYLKKDKLAKTIIPINFAKKFEESKTVEDFDIVLDILYDYADANDIWLGL